MVEETVAFVQNMESRVVGLTIKLGNEKSELDYAYNIWKIKNNL